MIHQGLTPQQVAESREKHGSNSLTPPPRTPLWKLFLEKFSDPVIRILLIAAFLSLGISFVHGEYYETIGIFCAIFLATGVAFWFEVDAARKFDILNQVNDDSPVRVVRDGQVREVGKKEIVVGDIILLETGDEVPADAELLEAVSLQVNESNLTGEPSAPKTVHPEEFKKDATYPGNHVLRGTTVIDGHGIARVIRVGDATEFGKVARQATVKSEEITPLNRQLDRLAKLIGVVGFALALVTFLALFLKDIFDGQDDFTLGQIGLLGAVLAGAAVALVKVWVPIVYDAFYLAGKPKELPAAVEKLGLHRGEHVAVIGGSMLGIFICRLLIYRQISPILIDSDLRRTDFAKSCGVYYTAPEDGKLIETVGTITGGRLTDNAVCIMTGNMEMHCKTAGSVCKPGRGVAFCGQIDHPLPIDLNEILRKRLTLSGVSVGMEHIPAAINLVANGAIDLNVYRMNVCGADGAESVFREFLSRADIPVDEINILSLV